MSVSAAFHWALEMVKSLLNPMILRLCVLVGTLTVVASFSTRTTAENEKAVVSTETTPLVPVQDDRKRNNGLTLFSSSSVRGREPSILEKQFRRFTVFRVALQVFIEYKIAQFRAKKLKKRLGLDLDDPDSDEHPELRSLWSKVHSRNANKLLHKIQKLEGFWVKVGQYLSSRGDVMPPEYLESLSLLQDSMPPRSWEDTWQTIQEELDEEALAKLEQIDRVPLSTASLAQVHRAVLKDHNGEKHHQVVLKVQHRGVASLMLQDMDNLRFILNMLAKTDPDLDFGPVIREYNQEVRKELDFRTEAANMKEVRQLLNDNNITAIIPETIPGFVTERCLVMDFCEGFPLRDTQKLDEYKVDRELLLDRVCAAWAVQMHVGAVFNADPHMGNILVSTVGEDPSVPVLLDFGLTKRLDPQIKIAFARLMHASHESNVDELLISFDEMGLKMNRVDPFQDLANMQRGFGSTVPQSEAREESKKRSQEYKKRTEAQRAEAGLKKGEKLRNPVEAWPSELVFFGRVTAMLRGMCSRLEVSYPYLKTMALAARETLKDSVPLEEHATDFIHPSAAMVDTPLQSRLIEALHQLQDEGHVVGLQVCVLAKGQEIAQVAAGTMGTANPRPVTPNTLFNVFSVSKGVLTIGLLHLFQDRRIESLDDPVAKYWPAFQSKPDITVRHLLSHQAGLANEYPEEATLDTLLDWSTMKDFVANHAIPSHPPGTKTQYHALSYAWLVGGLIEAITGKPYEDYLDKILPYNIKDLPSEQATRRNLFLAGISDDVDNHKDLAVLSLDRTNVEAAKKAAKPSQQDAIKLKSETKTKRSVEEEEDEEHRKKEARKVLEKYKGLQQLMNPSVFNMRKVREAKLPSANGHASARSLAEVFDAVIRSSHKNENGESILSRQTIELARIPSRTTEESNAQAIKPQAMLDDAGAKFGLGFQLHEFTLPNGEKVMSIGHAGLGGSLVLALPDEEVVIALTLNHLSSDSVARKRILGIIFDYLQWTPPLSIPVEATPTVDTGTSREAELVHN